MEKNIDDYGLYWDQAGTESENGGATPSEAAVPRQDPRVAESAEMSKAFDEPDQEVSIKEKAEPATFSEAFKAARAGGKGSFTWNGKSYTTQLKAEKKAAPAAKPAASSGKPAAPVSADSGVRTRAVDRMVKSSQGTADQQMFIPKKSK